ncbi:hypothetical protein GTW51_21730 [Aurantimonas aggregata]|uniref:Secreted protein n=1 Tax=Aurantimonas aggregata TaxID=2047720 RepID=A0A6L9MNZ4_9HYPH|nr:hypothetical protein [Aurantimonas aggregata]NDV89286.1 hypothetical protein [Aurantimonas aggregata]
MSFFLNKMASLLATLMVVGIALFCSSSALAHTSHGTDTAEAVALTLAGDLVVEEAAAATGDDGEVAGHRVASQSSCCGTGVSTCMAATTSAPAICLRAPPLATHGPALESGLLDGTSLDGLIRPPKAFV